MEAKMNNVNYWVTECDPSKLDKYYSDLLRACGFGILRKADYHFDPQGWTVLYLLSESHLAIHTFPEENKAYIELSSCIDAPFYRFNERRAVDSIENAPFRACVVIVGEEQTKAP